MTGVAGGGELRRMPGAGRAARPALGLLLAGIVATAAASPALGCTTASVPLPVAAYRAASPVVLGVVEEVGWDRLTVRVEVAYRGPAGRRVVLVTPGPVMSWCAFPFEPGPVVGSRVLLAVADRSWWAWPGSMAWTVDEAGRLGPLAGTPWTGAPTPRTVAEALATMGIAATPATSTAPAPAPTRSPTDIPLALAVAISATAIAAVVRRGPRPIR